MHWLDLLVLGFYLLCILFLGFYRTNNKNEPEKKNNLSLFLSIKDLNSSLEKIFFLKYLIIYALFQRFQSKYILLPIYIFVSLLFFLF